MVLMESKKAAKVARALLEEVNSSLTSQIPSSSRSVRTYMSLRDMRSRTAIAAQVLKTQHPNYETHKPSTTLA
jgi:hypothetical protein